MTPAIEIRDFWYSAKHDADMARHKSAMPTQCFIRGNRYTECCKVDVIPLTAHFGDLVYVGTGTTDEIVVVPG